jgi:3'-phosphoadenosine 5'-phosphosulfate (PAPS) 3'-phosphatase
MKKHIILIAAMVILLSAVGCREVKTEYNPAANDGSLRNEKESTEAAQKTEPSQTKSDNAKTEPEAVLKESKTQTEDKVSAVIISKSDNKLSSEEKEKALDDMSKELDRIIESLNNLDDIEDEDLEF